MIGGFLGLVLAGVSLGALQSTTSPSEAATECVACIHANMEFLASDAMRGRGSATHDELVAATYVASELRRAGIEPAAGAPSGVGDGLNAYLQRVTLHTGTVTAPPQLSFRSKTGKVTLIYGKDFYVSRISNGDVSGPLGKATTSESQVKAGAFVLLPSAASMEELRAKQKDFSQAAVLLAPVSADVRRYFRAQQLPTMPTTIEDVNDTAHRAPMVLYLEASALQRVKRLADGAILRLTTPIKQEALSTWNVIGKLSGSDPQLAQQAILLSAHIDHLGIGKPVNGDEIYNGADDDASGVTAVLEMARALGRGPKPRRTVIFGLFGSEEKGMLGSIYYREHPTVPLSNLVANLEFEMLGRRDPDLPQDSLFLTGWERTDMGPTLAQHGANLVADPHLGEHFFERSDNYALALDGVVAQTVSSFGLHKDYHQPSDEVSKVDWNHMEKAIGSLIGPVRWLANSDFRPQWVNGKQPDGK